jgi:hypothetical protein
MVAAGFGADNMVSLSGATMTGTLNLQGGPPLVIPVGAATGFVLTTDGSGNVSPQRSPGTPAVVALTFASTVAVNAAAGNDFRLTLTASTATLGAPSNPVDGQVIRIQVTQGTGGSFTLAHASAYDFGTAGSPTLSTAAGKVDILTLVYNAALAKWCCTGANLGF